MLMLLFIACPVKDEHNFVKKGCTEYTNLLLPSGQWECVYIYIYIVCCYIVLGGEIGHLISLQNKD